MAYDPNMTDTPEPIKQRTAPKWRYKEVTGTDLFTGKKVTIPDPENRISDNDDYEKWLPRD